MKLEKLLKHYSGGVAEQYEAARDDTKWATEQKVVSALLGSLPASATVLDIPVGTGRFVPAYQELGLQATGMDISSDMLTQARAKLRSGKDAVILRLSDIRKIDADPESFDCVVCMRFLNWIDARMLSDVLTELRRVSRKNLIVGIRHLVPASEIGFTTAGQAWRAARQWRRHIFRRNELIVHRKAVVEQIFRDKSLDVIERHCIEKDKRGTDYYIYFLQKR